MSSRRVPIAVGSGGTRTEESRAFNLVGAALVSAFDVPFRTGDAFHLMGTLVAGPVWALAS